MEGHFLKLNTAGEVYCASCGVERAQHPSSFTFKEYKKVAPEFTGGVSEFLKIAEKDYYLRFPDAARSYDDGPNPFNPKFFI